MFSSNFCYKTNIFLATFFARRSASFWKFYFLINCQKVFCGKYQCFFSNNFFCAYKYLPVWSQMCNWQRIYWAWSRVSLVYSRFPPKNIFSPGTPWYTPVRFLLHGAFLNFLIFCGWPMTSLNEDIELGRCIWRRLGISCTNALDARNLFFNNFRATKSELGYYDNIKILDKRLARQAITLHPNKNPNYQRATHISVLREEIIKYKEEISKINLRKVDGIPNYYLQVWVSVVNNVLVRTMLTKIWKFKFFSTKFLCVKKFVLKTVYKIVLKIRVKKRFTIVLKISC